MKKHFLLWLLMALAGPVAAQHTELIGRAGLGLLHFGGPDAARTSHVNYYRENGNEVGYTNSPYGRQAGLGFALGGRMQRVGRRQGLLAFDLGYDWLRSRTSVDVVDLYNGLSNMPRPADGTTYLRQQSLTAFLAVGHRLALPTVNIDVLAGPELAYIFGLREQGRGTYDGNSAWTTNTGRGQSLPVDVHLRAEATVWVRRVGLSTSYSYGLVNYQNGLVGASREVYARTLRLGLAYRLR